MSGCGICDGTQEPWAISMTGSWAHLDYVVYAGVRWFVHGAVYQDGATTLWLGGAA